MRKLTFFSLFLYFVVGSAFLYSEEAIENDNEQPQSSILPSGSAIIFSNGAGYLRPYYCSDGSTISYRELKENLSLIPVNEKFVRRADAWNIVNWISLGTAVGLAGGAMYFVNTDGGRSERAYTLANSAVGTALFGLSAQIMVRDNLDKAINNYNLTVMGVPVRYR